MFTKKVANRCTKGSHDSRPIKKYLRRNKLGADSQLCAFQLVTNNKYVNSIRDQLNETFHLATLLLSEYCATVWQPFTS